VEHVTAYLDQLARQRDEAQQLLHDAETELAELRPLRRQLYDAETAQDGAYRERAQLVAWLATIYPAVITPDPNVDPNSWQILYLTAGGHQLSWHISANDVELFNHVEHVGPDDPRAQWDGHTTAQKYEVIRALASTLAPTRAPRQDAACRDSHPAYDAATRLRVSNGQCTRCGLLIQDDRGQWRAIAVTA
jgi:hypothetical protein